MISVSSRYGVRTSIPTSNDNSIVHTQTLKVLSRGISQIKY